MYVLPFFWRLFRRNDQAIPRITKMTKSTVRDEINITQSGPSADGATVAKKKRLINRARYTNDDLLYMAAPTFYNWLKTDRYFLYNLLNYLKSFHHPTEKKFHLTCGWKSSKTTFLADELQFYQVQKIIFRLLFCNSSSRSVEDDSSLVGCSTRRLII